MSYKSLDELNSFINDSTTAKDNERVFTFIEFIKEFGYENSSEVFVQYYKDYLTLWSNKKKDNITKTDKEFVMEKMIDILKSITLDYSSYEEQDFIAHIDWSNKDHIRGMVSYYSRKIREITEFYRKKRNESHLIVKRNSMKGSAKSLEEIIYNKVVDFVFNNRHIIPSYANIRRDLIVSVENYVDTYSEYFDIPRNKNFTDRSRQEMLSANMNDVDYRNYLEISLVVSEILYSGNVYLEEIPLIAQLGIDLSQSCVGDMLALKDTLMSNTTINQIPLTEQVALKRKLYEKFLGCDLYYMYVDLQKNVKIDVLCKAKNPTGNLLNCGSVDTATIDSGQLELLSHIGLFFKPDKTSILKISAKDYTWSINEEKLEEDTIYIFPDPSKYGDIGNNKNSSYPLMMEYKMDYDIRNISSGESVNDPLSFITDQGWRSYYSKQDDDFKLMKNINYEYAMTSLANRGFIKSYQTDIWGNQFGLFKGYKEVYKKDETGKIIYDENRNPIVDKVIIPSKFNQELSYVDSIYEEAHPMIINGGYFEDPYHRGHEFKIENVYYSDKEDHVFLKEQEVQNSNGDFIKIYIKDIDRDENQEEDYKTDIKIAGRKRVPQLEINLYKNDISLLERFYDKHTEYTSYHGFLTYDDGGKPFDYSKKQTINENYHWTGLSTYNDMFYVPLLIHNHINFGTFGSARDVAYTDNYQVIKKGASSAGNEREDIIETVLTPFMSSTISSDGENGIKIETEDYDVEDFRDEMGTLFVRNVCDIKNRPQKFTTLFPWLSSIINSDSIINIQVIYESILIETEDVIYFIKYGYDGNSFFNPNINKEIIKLNKTDYLSTNYVLVEKEKSFYIAQSELNAEARAVNLHIYKFNCVKYSIEEIINFYDVVNKAVYEKNKLDTIKLWSAYVDAKKEINSSNNTSDLSLLLKGKNEKYPNFGDISLPYMTNYDIGKASFTYNSSLKLYLFSFIVMDANGSPFIYEFKFRLSNIDTFHDTLESNLYSIGGANIEDDIESRYFKTLTSDTICFPDSSITEPIFEEVV